MIRRKPDDDHENHERWLVSYADFITLLFAFFVVMYAISSVNQKKYDALSSSINTAFTSDKTTSANHTPQPSANLAKTPPPQKQKSNPSDKTTVTPQSHLSAEQIQSLQKERETIGRLGDELANNLSDLIGENKIRVIQNNRGLQIDISDSLLFGAGSAELAGNAKDLLNKIALLMHENNHAIQVEGHTDDTPIHTPLFYSNWELSAVRASSVVRMFSSLGVAENRLSALGFGSTQPISENITPEGRTKNRRVSIVVLYDSLKSDNNEDREVLPKTVTETPAPSVTQAQPTTTPPSLRKPN